MRAKRGHFLRLLKQLRSRLDRFLLLLLILYQLISDDRCFGEGLAQEILVDFCDCIVEYFL